MLSNKLVNDFVKMVSGSSTYVAQTPAMTGTIKKIGTSYFVSINGSSSANPYPIDTDTFNDGDVVSVEIKNHHVYISSERSSSILIT